MHKITVFEENNYQTLDICQSLSCVFTVRSFLRAYIGRKGFDLNVITSGFFSIYDPFKQNNIIIAVIKQLLSSAQATDMLIKIKWKLLSTTIKTQKTTTANLTSWNYHYMIYSDYLLHFSDVFVVNCCCTRMFNALLCLTFFLTDPWKTWKSFHQRYIFSCWKQLTVSPCQYFNWLGALSGIFLHEIEGIY